MDVARKGLIIARESGYDIELSDIQMFKVFPDNFDSSGTVEEFLKKLPEVDDYFAKKIADLKKKGFGEREKVEVEGEEKAVTYFVLNDEGKAWAPTADAE